MKQGLLLLVLVLLVLAGTVSAATIGSAVSIQPAARQAVVVEAPKTATVSFDASVAGATVYVDNALVGRDEAHSKTPLTGISVAAGDHTATFRLAGYNDYTTRFHATAGVSQTVYAQMVRLSRSIVSQQDISAPVSLQAQITMHPVAVNFTTTTVPATQGGGTITCPEGYTCMPLSVAQKEYGTYTQYSQNSCGMSQVTQPSQPQIMYCFKKKVEAVRAVVPDTLIARADAGAVGAVQGNLPGNVSSETGARKAAGPATALSQIPFVGNILDGIFGGLFGTTHQVGPVAGDLENMKAIDPQNATWYTVGPEVRGGGTVFVGEQGLDLGPALNAAAGTPLDGTPPITKIGVWIQNGYTLEQMKAIPPMKTVDLAGRYSDMTIDPVTFLGYTGSNYQWWLVDPEKGGIHVAGMAGPLMVVENPEMALTVTNAQTGTSVQGTTVHRGDQLAFTISKNIWVSNTVRGPLTGTADDGFVDIVIHGFPGSGGFLATVDTPGGSAASLKKLCGNQNGPYPGTVPSCNPGFTWNTADATKYPSGHYAVQAVSRLNNMRNNYLNAGMPYTGRTVSETILFELV